MFPGYYYYPIEFVVQAMPLLAHFCVGLFVDINDWSLLYFLVFAVDDPSGLEHLGLE